MKAFAVFLLALGFTNSSYAAISSSEMGSRLDALVAGIDSDAKLIYTVSLGQKPLTWLPTELQAKDTDRSADPTANKLREFSSMIVSKPSGGIEFGRFTEGTNSAVMINTYVPPGAQAMAQFHTHPWQYEQLKNIAFSPRDIESIYHPNETQKFSLEFPYLLLAGDEYFALVVLDADKALARFQSLSQAAQSSGLSLHDSLQRRYNGTNTGTDIEDIMIHSVMSITGAFSESGIGFFRKKVGQGFELLNP